MKIFTLILLLFTFFATNIFAQNMTIILVRHAEKDSSPMMNRSDPDLSPEGKTRAIKLLDAIKTYKPERIFSTNLKRTKFTVDPTATNLNEKFRIFVEVYNPTELESFAKQLLNTKAKSILVAGHSNTTPTLANLLIKQDKYKDLGEAVYNKIYIIRIRGNKITDEVIDY